MTNNTLTLLVKRFMRDGRFRAVKQIDLDGNPSWSVFSPLAEKSVYGHLTQHQAEVVASLCNITDDPDWSTLQPYVDELLPGLSLIPKGLAS